MRDLVERLRRRAATRNTGMSVASDDYSTMGYYSAGSASLDKEAADRIEALEAALRFALEVMESNSAISGHDPSHATPSSAIGVARAALAPEQDK